MSETMGFKARQSGSMAHPFNYYAVRNISWEELKNLPKFTLSYERLIFFRGRFWLGRKGWHFEGQASNTEKCTEYLIGDIEYKPHYFITVFNSTYKIGSD